jgi:hypothetical protein
VCGGYQGSERLTQLIVHHRPAVLQSNAQQCQRLLHRNTRVRG